MTFNVTEAASAEIKRLMPEEFYLRVSIVGGGCSGLSYKLAFDNAPVGGSDKVLTTSPMIVTDAKSALFLDGVTLDFSDGLEGKGFEFQNPNAKRTCGCGSSFS